MNLETKNKLSHLNKKTIPPLLDKKYGYLLSNGFYNYQEYINYQALKAQAGDSEALEECLYYFGWRGEGAPSEILSRYYYMLTSASIDTYNRSSMSFVRLFCREEELKILKNNRLSIPKSNLVVYKLEGISNRLVSYKSKKEILNDLIDLLIDRILKYKQGERTLRKYLDDMFHLYVGDYVQRVFRGRDFMKLSQSRSYININEIIDKDTSFPMTYESDDLMYEKEKQQGVLDLFWLSGYTHPVFDSLTRTEKLILRDIHYLGLTQEQVAEKLSVGRTTVRTSLNNSKKKLRVALDNQDESWLEKAGYQTFKY